MVTFVIYAAVDAAPSYLEDDIVFAASVGPTYFEFSACVGSYLLRVAVPLHFGLATREFPTDGWDCDNCC